MLSASVQLLLRDGERVWVAGRHSHVLCKEKGLQEETCCSQNAHQGEDPQEYPVNHHGNVLPVILNFLLREKKTDR